VPHAWHVRRRGLAAAPVIDTGLTASELAGPEL